MCMSIRPQVSQGIESLTRVPNPSKVTTTKPDPTGPVVDKPFKPKDFSTAKTPERSDADPVAGGISFKTPSTPEQLAAKRALFGDMPTKVPSTPEQAAAKAGIQAAAEGSATTEPATGTPDSNYDFEADLAYMTEVSERIMAGTLTEPEISEIGRAREASGDGDRFRAAMEARLDADEEADASQVDGETPPPTTDQSGSNVMAGAATQMTSEEEASFEAAINELRASTPRPGPKTPNEINGPNPAENQVRNTDVKPPQTTQDN